MAKECQSRRGFLASWMAWPNSMDVWLKCRRMACELMFSGTVLTRRSNSQGCMMAIVVMMSIQNVGKRTRMCASVVLFCIACMMDDKMSNGQKSATTAHPQNRCVSSNESCNMKRIFGCAEIIIASSNISTVYDIANTAAEIDFCGPFVV